MKLKDMTPKQINDLRSQLIQSVLKKRDDKIRRRNRMLRKCQKTLESVYAALRGNATYSTLLLSIEDALKMFSDHQEEA